MLLLSACRHQSRSLLQSSSNCVLSVLLLVKEPSRAIHSTPSPTYNLQLNGTNLHHDTFTSVEPWSSTNLLVVLLQSGSEEVENSVMKA